MKRKTIKLNIFSPFLCVCSAIITFLLAISLVEVRQKMVLSGRELSELEKKISSYAMKNTELDARILKLSSSESLRAVIASDGLVLADGHAIVKIPKVEAAMYALNRANGRFAAEFSPKNFQAQTNLNTNN
ncbi:MAG: hypothetical protein LBI56_01670 [Puniceicoccales bacterium]|jgi:cell division protein FtsL|nr:hypothetical protein [Puniceicoccales bacterium]